MKKRNPSPRAAGGAAACGKVVLAAAASLPAAAHGQGRILGLLPVEVGAGTLSALVLLLVGSAVLYLVFHRRFNRASSALKDVAEELEATRQRLAESGREAEQARLELKETAARYQNILFDAGVGMFQIDLDGACTFVNSALQEMSGLYPKKALKEGLHSAVHPEDRQAFEAAWRRFAAGEAPFEQRFRFVSAKGRVVHALCKAGKIHNARKEVESYIGWVADITRFDDEREAEKAVGERYGRFVAETLESFYQLVPETPIPLSTPPAKLAEAIMGKMAVSSCNETFAALYGSSPAGLHGKTIADLPGGCGPFRNADAVRAFIEAGLKAANLESVRQDANGNRINLSNNAVGLVEDNRLVGIWGWQRNISHERREKAELASQAQFMRRVLGALPADVHVKDTRCRYLYASKKLADRTGIPQGEWVGKTIFEVMPATPREHDQHAIDAMKSGRLVRIERPFEVRGKSGWMETLHMPLVSDEGLVEGVVGLSIDVSERKKREEETRGERTKAEEALRQSAERLRARLKQLEEQLALGRRNLEAESDKRRKWEELLGIKEEGLRKIETRAAELARQVEELDALRGKAEAGLETHRRDLAEARRRLEELEQCRAEESKAGREGRLQSEKDLAKTAGLLQKAQEQLRLQAEQHSAELEHEAAGHKASAEKLIQSMEELDELKQLFNYRIEEETKTLKQELAKRQIQEKGLRQQGKELEGRIQELEGKLRAKAKEQNEQIQAREGAEMQLRQTEQKLEQLARRQQDLISRETQKLNLKIAEIRLEEIKLRKIVGDLQQEKEAIEDALGARTAELSDAAAEYKRLATAYKAMQAKLKHLAEGQQAVLEEKTTELRNELAQLRHNERDLRGKERSLAKHLADQEQNVNKLLDNLKQEAAARKGAEQELAELRIAFEASQHNAEALVDQQTAALSREIERHRKNEAETAARLAALQESLGRRERSIEELREQHRATEQRMRDAEALLERTKQDHRAELKRTLAEVRATGRLNSELVDELSAAVQESLNPVIKSTLLLEKAGNLSDEQKRDLDLANHRCRRLIDMLRYRSELTHLADGGEGVPSGPCDLHGLIKEIDRQFCHRAETKKIFFAVSFAQYQSANNVPKMVETDGQKLRKILSILLGYAMERTEKGRLGMHAARKSGGSGSANIAFEFTYTAKEAKDELLSDIFGDGDGANRVDLQYGLTLARRYIGMLDGAVQLEYRDGGATALTVEFPFRKAAAEVVMPPKDVAAKRAGAA